MIDNNKPILYSKTSLMIFSIFSCFFSGLLYVQNLRELHKNKFIFPIVLYSIFLPTILIKVSTSMGIPSYYSYIPINLLGGFLLIKPFWDYQIAIYDYNKRNIIGPALIVLGLIGLIVFLVLIKR